MAKFITSIQLHKADEADYAKLNNEMEKASFHLKKDAASGKSPGIKRKEYNCTGNITLKDVADAVYRAVKKTGRDYSFTIMRNKGNYNMG
ncbi:MAG: hypothetical protein ABIQ88_12965 [Chitinophagaceae bacterium]